MNMNLRSYTPSVEEAKEWAEFTAGALDILLEKINRADPLRRPDGFEPVNHTSVGVQNQGTNTEDAGLESADCMNDSAEEEQEVPLCVRYRILLNEMHTDIYTMWLLTDLINEMLKNIHGDDRLLKRARRLGETLGGKAETVLQRWNEYQEQEL